MACALICLRSVILGWVALMSLGFLERPLVGWIAPLVGGSWIATAHLLLDCAALAAAGWAAGRWARPYSLLAAGIFALTLCFRDFGDVLALNVPWLLRLLKDSFEDSRFLDSLIASVETHALLFGCLMAGAALGRPKEKPVSIAG